MHVHMGVHVIRHWQCDRRCGAAATSAGTGADAAPYWMGVLDVEAATALVADRLCACHLLPASVAGPAEVAVKTTAAGRAVIETQHPGACASAVWKAMHGNAPYLGWLSKEVQPS